MNDDVMSSNASVAVAGYLNGTDWLLIGGSEYQLVLGHDWDRSCRYDIKMICAILAVS